MSISKLEVKVNAGGNLSVKPQSTARKKLRVVGPGPTGPRTKRGKRKARYNAIKHGIFSEAILKGHESKAQFHLLFTSLRDYFQPQGAMEEILVEKLCMQLWRHRRLLQAECAEIAKIIEFIDDDAIQDQRFDRQDRRRRAGILHHCNNPLVLDDAINLLEHLRDHLQEHGFDPEYGLLVLEKLYGFISRGDLCEKLVAEYEHLEKIAKLHEQGGEDKGQLTPDDAQRKAIGCVEKEIKRLERMRGIIADIENGRIYCQSEASMVPPQDTSDRLLRYEASLDRSFDRTLNQLERLQRIRLGQAVAPPLKVVLSH